MKYGKNSMLFLFKSIISKRFFFPKKLNEIREKFVHFFDKISVNKAMRKKRKYNNTFFFLIIEHFNALLFNCQ